MVGLTDGSIAVKGFGGQTGCIQIPALLKFLASVDLSFLKSGGNNYIHTYTRVPLHTCIHTYTYIMLCMVCIYQKYIVCSNMLMTLIITHDLCIFIKCQEVINKARRPMSGI